MSDSGRPIIKIPLTIADKVFEIIGILVLIAFWIFTLKNYHLLPEIIPTHFDGSGKPDGYGAKWTIITLPIVGTLMYIALTLLVRIPHKFNYIVAITEANAALQYRIMTKMLRRLKIVLLLVFFLLDYQTVQIALGWPDIFGRWFILILFATLFIPIFYFLIQSSKNS